MPTSSLGIVASGRGTVISPVLFDAATDSGSFTADKDFTHTPVGTPKAVVLMVMAYAATTDQFISATYGGVTMTQLYLASPVDYTVAAENDGYLYTLSLHSDIPTGAQTVHIDMGTSVTMQAVCVTMTCASGNTGLMTYTVRNDQTGSNPSIPLTITENCFCLGHVINGTNTSGNIAPAAGMTQLFEANPSGEVWSSIYRTTNPTTDTTIGWTVTSQEWAGIAVAVRVYDPCRTPCGEVRLPTQVREARFKQRRLAMAANLKHLLTW